MKQKFPIHRQVIRVIFLIVLAMSGLFGISLSATAPEFPAEAGGVGFAECPDSPNCVSTQTSSAEHRMDPIPWQASVEQAKELIKETVANEFPRVQLVAETPSYLRYEFTSLIFRFVDDVEFLIDAKSKMIHFRSASRVGHSDLGANKRRMIRFLSAFQNQQEPTSSGSRADADD
jgi:uncharacterized protein (DUF1499 family)